MFTYNLDTRAFMQGFALVRSRSRTNTVDALHRAVAFVVEDAKDQTKKVTVGTIDSELAVKVVPRIGARGKPLSMKNSKNRNYTAGGLGKRGSPDIKPAVPLLYLIMSARAKAGSNFNRLTGNRWRLPMHPAKGLRGPAMWRAMEDAQGRMVRNRHRTTAWFHSSWNAIISQLAGVVPSGYRAHFLKVAGRAAIQHELGRVTFADPASDKPTVIIENMVGMAPGKVPMGASGLERRNEAAHRVLGPALQRAIDANYVKALELAYKQGMQLTAPQMLALGFKVTA